MIAMSSSFEWIGLRAATVFAETPSASAREIIAPSGSVIKRACGVFAEPAGDRTRTRTSQGLSLVDRRPARRQVDHSVHSLTRPRPADHGDAAAGASSTRTFGAVYPMGAPVSLSPVAAAGRLLHLH